MYELASTLGQIFSPLFKAMSWLLAFYFSLVPSYVFAIALLTVTVMIISFPLNRASTRSMFKMQLLQPEVQKLRNRYKTPKDATIAERQESRQKLNEEMMALYRENNVSMAGGCLPNLVIFPIFIILYDVIRGLTNTCTALAGVAHTCATTLQLKGATHTHVIWNPRYITSGTKLYHALASTSPPGKMLSFGINLASSVRTPQHSWVDVLPFVFVVALAVGLQYVQLKQMTGRNTQTGQVAQQMQAMQKFMPLVMAVIYISIPAAVTIYFIVSSLFRIGQQEWMYRRDPQIVQAFAALKARKAGGGASGGTGKPKGAPGGSSGPKGPRPRTPEPSSPAPASPPRGFRARLAAALAPEGMEALQSGKTADAPTTTNGKTGATTNGAARPRSGNGAGAGAGGRTGSGGSKAPGAAKSGGTAKPASSAKPGSASKPAPSARSGSAGKPAATGSGRSSSQPRPAGGAAGKTTSNGASAEEAEKDQDRSQPRADGKRPRRPR